MNQTEVNERVLSLIRRYEIDLEGWYVGHGPALMVTCSDQFFWGSADCEVVTSDNLSALEATLEELQNEDGDEEYAPLLWVARQRHMRLQGAAYTYIPERLWPLFDAAGPERETGLGNPCAPGEYKPERQVT